MSMNFWTRQAEGVYITHEINGWLYCQVMERENGKWVYKAINTDGWDGEQIFEELLETSEEFDTLEQAQIAAEEYMDRYS